MASKKIIRFLFVISITLGILTHSALAGPGNCDKFDFPINPQGGVDWPHTVKVIKQDTLVYEDAISFSTTSSLNFNKSLRVLDLQGDRVQVGHVTTLAPLGWVERSALLCALSPLKGSKSGLEQKLYIQTATEVRGEKPTTVKAYPSPDLQGCEGQCRELSRFEGYFVFDIEGKPENEGEKECKECKYLLSETYKLDDTSQLVGWVSGENGFIWDTAYGMRPQENLIFPEGTVIDGKDMSGQERTICAYEQVENALNDPLGTCLPILGGDRWYLSEHRIPILEKVEQGGQEFYQVVLPLPGRGVKKEGEKIIIDPKDIIRNPGIDTLITMKHVDVLFLIDGTKSMVHHLQAVKGAQIEGKEGIVQQIVKTLQEEEAFKEAQFRFGFRIYRDTYAGELELDEGLPLSPACELTLEAKERNIQEFGTAIDRVVVTEEARDDYAENLFGGIKRATRDLAPCPENTKLLFIIGDCGYDADTQQSRGITPVEISSLVRSLKGGDEIKNIVTFFIQTPQYTGAVKNLQEYAHAYNLFTEQAHSILRQVLGPDRGNEIENYFMTTDAADLNAKILTGVKQFSNAQVINELILDLRGGTSLKNAIERLQGSEEYNNIPGLFWDLVEQGSCKKLGEQCTERTYDTVVDAYIPISEDIVEDVWLKSEDLDTWISLLRNFDSTQISQLSGTEIRQAFVDAMKEGLEKVIRKPLYEDTKEPLREYLKRKGGLPVSDTSPLFRYSIADLLDPDAVPDCEVIRLTIWVNNSKQMLNILYHGDLRPVYTEEAFPGECPTGEHIPFISGDIQSAPLGKNPDMRYDHSFQKAKVYWVPKEFLP